MLAAVTVLALRTTWVPILDDANLIFHEAGHTLFMFFGETLYILGGSLFQILLPLGCGFVFLRRREFFSSLIMTWWAGENMIGVGRYIADARTQLLPLIGGEHDWAVLLSGHPRLLTYDTTMGLAVETIGIVLMSASLLLALTITLKTRPSQIPTNT